MRELMHGLLCFPGNADFNAEDRRHLHFYTGQNLVWRDPEAGKGLQNPSQHLRVYLSLNQERRIGTAGTTW